MSSRVPAQPETRTDLTQLRSASLATVREFLDTQPFQLAAALSYYTLLSIAQPQIALNRIRRVEAAPARRGYPLAPAPHARAVRIMPEDTGGIG